ncbi:DUF2182 domain-containing protein [Caballeronia sp. LZ062]|uniref:DUF2182 domain-containing protein n=1 Tax=unclassified Caballeronia TaxID=2646786 RepID=UPI002864065E|nr:MULTISPECIES: DUF2182 domain-containing protein [unclassified Caballeronia]MDR5856147.1 DUF2182 domain-containing protein [Caballeronia sp. LZ050]MDR5872818.1 DUF2182 domain-containing protein [Caballeronia sp. LZ062]
MTNTLIERAMRAFIVAHGNERRALAAMHVFAFMLSAAVLVACHAAMPSMNWTRPCGATALGAAAAFVGMWTIMMTAMMLPSFAHTLWLYRASRVAPLALMTAGYVTAWSIAGMAMYWLGASSSTLFLAKPVTAGAVLFLAGMVQSSQWKARWLARCRSPVPRSLTVRDAYGHGTRHGLQCLASCAGLTVALCVAGMTNASPIAAVTLAIAAERMLPHGERLARYIGVIVIVLGMARMLDAST